MVFFIIDVFHLTLFEIRLIKQRHFSCLGRTRFFKSNIMPKCIEIYIDNHSCVDKTVQTGCHEISHFLLGYQSGHSEIWKQTTGLLMAIVDIILQRPKGTRVAWIPFVYGLNFTKLHNIDFDTFVY